MTTVESATAATATEQRVVTSKSYRVPIILGVFALLAIVLFVVFGRDGISNFSFSGQDKGSLTLGSIPLGVRATGIVVSIIAVLMALGSAFFVRSERKTPLWYIAVFAVIVIIGFLAWTTANHNPNITGLLTNGLALSAPLIFGALGGVVSERVGVTNVAIEGQLLAGAFAAAVTATVTGSLVVGIISAMIAGVLVSFILGAFAVKYAVNQVIVGIVLNVLVLGLTTFLYQTVLVNNVTTLNNPPELRNIDIPLLSEIPVLGPLLFSQNLIVYLMYVAVIVVTIGLFRTRWGLRLRAVGEHPQAADTVGINVARTRFWNVALAGAIVGLGGAFFTIGNVGAFSQNITSGDGYIALAAVIFGRWNPVRATLAALLFGFCSNLGSALGILGSPVPNDFLLMLPYLVTIFAVAGLVGRVRGPAAAGRPYIKS
jgi:ABC-type uncharacterized transport system permease subunit